MLLAQEVRLQVPATLQCSREVGIVPLLRDSLSNKTSVEPLLGCCVCSLGGTWVGGSGWGVCMQRCSAGRPAPTWEEREKQAKATTVMAKVLYYVHRTPATLHRARTRICYFTYQYKVTIKNIKHFWGPGFPQEERHRDEPGIAGWWGAAPHFPQLWSHSNQMCK